MEFGVEEADDIRGAANIEPIDFDRWEVAGGAPCIKRALELDADAFPVRRDDNEISGCGITEGERDDAPGNRGDGGEDDGEMEGGFNAGGEHGRGVGQGGRVGQVGRGGGVGRVGGAWLFLKGGDGGDGDDVVDGAAAAEIIDRLGAALEEWAKSHGFSKALDELVADVTGVKIGEDEDVGFAGDRAARGFFSADRRDDGSIGLELAIDHEMRSALFHELGGLDHFVDNRIFSAALCGKGEHGDNWFDADERTARVGGHNGDIGKLFGGGVGHDAAVSEDKKALVAVGAIGDDH